MKRNPNVGRVVGLWKVLIVDDENLFREYLRRVICWEDYGFTVIDEAKDGKDACQKIAKWRPDLVFTDINMPHLDGLALAERIKKESRDTITVIITGYSEFEYARKALKLGVEDFLLKPFDRQELENILHKVKPRLEELREEKEAERTLVRKLLLSSIESGYGYIDKDDVIRIEKHYQDAVESLETPDIQAETESCLRGMQQALEAYDKAAFRREWKKMYDYISGFRLEYEQYYTIFMGSLVPCFYHILERGHGISEVLGKSFRLYAKENIRTEDLYDNIALTYTRTMDFFEERKPCGLHKIAFAVKEYIDGQYTKESISTGSIAGELYIDASYIRKAFKTVFQTTVTDYINKKRLEKAALMLREKQYKTSEIAMLVGYKDNHYFSRLFKKYYGFSPRDYGVD